MDVEEDVKVCRYGRESEAISPMACVRRSRDPIPVTIKYAQINATVNGNRFQRLPLT